MSTIIISALALALFQYAILPACTKLNDIAWLISSRDDAKDPTLMQARMMRAITNLKESLPAFLALCLLAMIQQIDLSQLGLIWLGLRIVYIPCYLFSINPVRTLVWFASIACLIMMAIKLV